MLRVNFSVKVQSVKMILVNLKCDISFGGKILNLFNIVIEIKDFSLLLPI